MVTKILTLSIVFYLHTYQVSYLTSEHFASFVNPADVATIAYYSVVYHITKFSIHQTPWVNY